MSQVVREGDYSTQEASLFTYHNVQRKSCLVEKEEQEVEEEDEVQKEEAPKDLSPSRTLRTLQADLQTLQAEARRRYSGEKK